MGARTGQEYLERLRSQRPEVYIQGERIEDVTTHPATRQGARSMAHLYDMQHDPALKAEMTYPSPTSGEPVGMSFLTPRTKEDLAKRHRMMRHWAEWHHGYMGRTPDYLNSSLMAMAAAADFFAGNDPRFGENIRRYYEYVRENDLCLTHTLINPQANRGAGVAQQPDPYLPAGVLAETDSGIVIRGCRLLATLAPLSDELMVFPSTVLRSGGEGADKYAFAFAIPCATPGLKFICRESFDLGRSHFDHPLGSRFEEMDAVVVFDDVHVPWERVFLYRDVERCNAAYGATNAVVHMAHQVLIKNVAKAEFLLGLVCLMIDTIAIEQFQHVQEKAAEIITYLETMRACLRAAEADATLDQWGVMTPARPPVDVARNMFPKMYPRMVEIVQQLGASGLMAAPTEADFQNPAISAEVHKFFQAARANSLERVKLFRLAWDVACSSFGARQVLYERFFFGDPVRMAGALYSTYPKEAAMARVREFLDRDFDPARFQPPADAARPATVPADN